MKRMLALILAIAMSLCLSACGGSTPANASAAPSTAPTASASSAAPSSNYPAKAIKIIVPYSAGGATDMGGRVVASVLPSHLTGATCVVENQAGGAAVPGTLAMAQADPDGYTLGYNWEASWLLRPQIMDTGYSYEDYTFIAGITVQKNALYVTEDSPFKTLEDLLSYMKEHPGELNYSCGAAGSWQQMIAGTLFHYADVEAVEVPYEGARPSALAMMAGDVDFCVLELATCTAELEAGTVRALCTFEGKRNEQSTPDVRAIGECGYPEVATIAQQRTVICGPAGLPDDVVEKLSASLKSLCEDENFIMLMENCDLVPEFADSETITNEIINNYPLLTDIIKASM